MLSLLEDLGQVLYSTIFSGLLPVVILSRRFRALLGSWTRESQLFCSIVDDNDASIVRLFCSHLRKF